MALNSEAIVRRILPRLSRAGIDIEVSGEESQTVEMVRAIVDEVVKEIVTYGEVIVIQVSSQGVGNLGGPVLSQNIQPGKGIIR